MQHEVVLHGYMAGFHDGPIRMVGKTIAEVVEGVTRQLKGFHDRRHRVKVVGCNTEADLHKPLTESTKIQIIPQLNGGKKGGLLQILLGAVLIGVGLFLGAATLVGGLLIKVGAMSLLGGIAQLLAPQPEVDKDDDKKNRYLGPPRNTVAIGTRIPILYGERRVGGHYISFDITAADYRTRR